jgi:hypothetical protein
MHSNQSVTIPGCVHLKNTTIHLQGKLTSDIFSALTLTISKCNSAVHGNCVSDGKIDGIESKIK